MSISQWAAAKTICESGGWRVSNLALQKILYLADMVHIGRHGVDDPLIEEAFQAWDYGPVLPDLYHRAKIFGSGPVRDVFYSVESVKDGPEGETLLEACQHLLSKTPRQLVAMTHWQEGAWAKHYHAGSRSNPIPREDMLTEYRARTAKIRERVAA